MSAGLPIYYQIKNKIKDWIVNKEYCPGDKIPTENELAKIFNVTRVTVRQGIAPLVQEGLLKIKRGEGTFVTEDQNLINNLSIEIDGFLDSLFYQVSKSKTKWVEIKKVVATTSIKDKLKLNRDEEVICIKRERFINDKPFAYTINFLPIEIGARIQEKDLYEKPLLQILEQDLGIIFKGAFQTIEASFSDQESSGKLGIPTGSPILLVERIMYDKNNNPVELVRSSYRGDIYKYVMRLKIDKQKMGRYWIEHSG